MKNIKTKSIKNPYVKKVNVDGIEKTYKVKVNKRRIDIKSILLWTLIGGLVLTLLFVALVVDKRTIKKVVIEENKVYVGTRTITIYTSTVEQTDSTPCIGAMNTDICALWLSGENLCASNEFPFGTVLYIGGYFRNRCVVMDRMNSRYTTNIDWYGGFDQDCLDGVDKGDNCPNYLNALKFGSQSIETYLLK